MGCCQIISFVILAVLRRSLLRVRGSHLSVILPAGNTDTFKMLQRWQPVGSTVSDLIGPRFEQQTSCSRDGHVTARPTARLVNGWVKSRFETDACIISRYGKCAKTVLRCFCALKLLLLSNFLLRMVQLKLHCMTPDGAAVLHNSSCWSTRDRKVTILTLLKEQVFHCFISGTDDTHWSFLSTHWVVGFIILHQMKRRRYIEVASF